MKLLFYINTIRHGGAERVLTQLAKMFSMEGNKVILVTSYFADDEYGLYEGIERICLENSKLNESKIKRNVTRILKLRKILKEEKPDAVISFMKEPNFRTIIASIGLPNKVITSVRNDPNREYSGFIGTLVGKIILPLSNGCIFQTKDAQQWFPKKLIKKSCIIFNAVDESFYNVQKDFGENIVSVGRLSKQKNFKMLIEAFSQIKDQFCNVNLEIYGKGEEEEELLTLIKQLNLIDRVKLKGISDNIPNVLKKAKLFVLSSDYEGMPNCLMEAMAVGVPCIATNCPCGGPRALICNDINGILIPINDKECMSNAIFSVLNNESMAHTLGENARKKAEEFHPDIIFKQWKSFIERVISNDI